MEQDTTFVGLDTHKTSISVALAEGGRGGEVRAFGVIENRPAPIERLVVKLAARHKALDFCYEAGPCGYDLYRQINALGHGCTVVAPSLIPKRPGDRIKTNRRDALNLARLHRAGELTAVWVPEPAHEAMRDLVRAREAAMTELRRARQQLHGFLLRHGRVYHGRSHWTKAHRVWLARLRFDHPAHYIVLQDSLHAIEAAAARLEGLEAEIARLVPDWSLAPLVEAFQALRGVGFLSAVILAAELGALSRFETPRRLMGYLGLVPSEHSSGDKQRRGALTKAGNRRVRRVLVEGAWSYRLPARISAVKQAHLAKLPEPVRAIAWKAQTRLCARYRRLVAKGKPKNLVTAAIAREMAAFLWAIARELTPPPGGQNT